MRLIGLLLLLVYNVRGDDGQCPVQCNCVRTEQEVDGRDQEVDLDANANGFSKATAYPSKGNLKENADSEGDEGEEGTERGTKGEMFTYQITCDGLRDLGTRSRSPPPFALPSPTTQLIIRATCFESVNAFYWTLQFTTWKIPQLTDFSITNSEIERETIHDKIEPLWAPEEPYCKHLQILNLSNNTLTYLPQGLFLHCNHLQTLDLSNNQITNFDDEILHPLINLQRLDLHGNNLKWLSDEIFRNLTKLLTLDISYNAISKLSPSTFQYLINLNTLIVANNPLTTIVSFVGVGKRLYYINISKTGLRQIPSTLERSVRVLQLSDNLLTSIQCGDLDSYPLLATLHLNHNKISYTEDDAMGRLELLTNLQLNQNTLFQVPKSLPNHLEILNLSHNILQNISRYDFLNLSDLRELSLSNNRIKVVEKNAFINLNNLEILDLSKNPLLSLSPMNGLSKLRILNLSYCTVIPVRWRKIYQSFPTPTPSSIHALYLDSSPLFTQLFLEDTGTLQLFTNITTLYLRFSNVTTLRKDIFDYLPKLTEMRLEGNPWHCDREIITTAAWLRVHEKDILRNNEVNLNTVHCATPPKLYKKLLRNISSKSFQLDSVALSKTYSAKLHFHKKTTFSSENSISANLPNITSLMTVLNSSKSGNSSFPFPNTEESTVERIMTSTALIRVSNREPNKGPQERNSINPIILNGIEKHQTTTSNDTKTLSYKSNLNYTNSFLFVLIFVSSAMVITLVVSYMQILRVRWRHRRFIQRQIQEMEIPSISIIANDLW